MLVLFFSVNFFLAAQTPADSSETCNFYPKFSLYLTPLIPVDLEGAHFAYGASFDLGFETDVSHHHISYSIFDNSLTTLHGYFLDERDDVYLLGSKSLSSRDFYMSAGYERYFDFNWVKLIPFYEIGVLLPNKDLSFSFGVNAEFPIFKLK
jgi:hypothetical protein